MNEPVLGDRTMISALDDRLHFRRALDLCAAVRDAATRRSVSAYLVGGAVRDLLLKKREALRDFDFTVQGGGLELAHAVQEVLGGEVTPFGRFLTAKLFIPSHNLSIDFVSTRSERYHAPGALPEVSQSTLSEDLARRDFSINALALPVGDLLEVVRDEHPLGELRPFVIDEHGGLEDLDTRRIRTLHASSFLDDPTRLFRACRYAVRINGELESLTDAHFREAVTLHATGGISGTRIANECRKMWEEYECAKVFALAAAQGLLGSALGIDGPALTRFLHALDRLLHYFPYPRGSAPIGAFVLLRLLSYYQSKGNPSLLFESRLKRKEIMRIEAEVAVRGKGGSVRDLPLDSLLFWHACGESKIPPTDLEAELVRRMRQPAV
jgi:tRNA nucleotidyltransferase/poly(A) polymerase